MRIERVSDRQFTIFLTFDDMLERGFTKEDLWEDASSVRDLFSDMMYEASTELDFELEGMLFVQVQFMQAQGMHVIVTQKPEKKQHLDADYVEMKVTLDESRELIYKFSDFENIIQVAPLLANGGVLGGKVYFWKQDYYMLLTEGDLWNAEKENIIAIMSEFSSPSIVTSHRLQEYGKVIMDQDAVQKIRQIFPP